MQSVLESLVADSLERPLPSLVRRDATFPEAEGNACAVIGMRRTGKTWYCYQRMQDLVAAGVPREHILYVNFEDERLLEFSAGDFQILLDAFFRRTHPASGVKIYLFLDEVQRAPGWPQFVRRMLDQGDMDVTLTGSSARLLSAEIHTSLRGRALPCEIFPYSFAEYLAATGLEKPEAEPSTRQRARLEAACEDYLYAGGFPGLLSLAPDLRRQMLQQYLDVVVLRDVIERHGVTSVPALRALVRHLVHAPATRVSINKMYNDLKSRGLACSKNNLHEFVEYLADAFLVFPIPVHTRNERVRRANPRKVYLVDTGLAAAASADITRDRGALLENFVFLHLRRLDPILEYFQQPGGIEADFVVRDRLTGAATEVVQACWSLVDEKTRQRELRGLTAAMQSLGLKRGTIVTWRDESHLNAAPGIDIVPAWRFALARSAH